MPMRPFFGIVPVLLDEKVGLIFFVSQMKSFLKENILRVMNYH
jgi:hypothetical protein